MAVVFATLISVRNRYTLVDSHDNTPIGSDPYANSRVSSRGTIPPTLELGLTKDVPSLASQGLCSTLTCSTIAP